MGHNGIEWQISGIVLFEAICSVFSSVIMV